MTDKTNEKKEIGELVRIEGLALNIAMIFLLIPLIPFIYFIKTQWMNDEIIWNDRILILKNLMTFLLCLFTGPLLHDLIRFIILTFLGAKPVKIKIKNNMFFLYSPKQITVKQVIMTFIIPYIIVIMAFLISMIYFNVVIAIGMASALVVTSDSLIMCIKLFKFDKNLLCIQEENFLGYTVIK